MMILLRLNQFLLTCIITLALTVMSHQSLAEDSSVLEYRVKAVCLYNFAKYIKWPDASFASPKAPMKLCIVGRNPFGNLFNDAQGKTAQDRPLAISFIKNGTNMTEIQGCHIVFTTEKDTPELAPMFNALKGKPVLTVTETPEHGIVHFFIQEGKVRFGINLKLAKEAALNISSQLLRLAKVSDDEKEE